MPTIYVGIDVSKYKFDACIKNENDDVIMKPKVYAQNLDGIQRLIHDMDHARKEGSTKVLIGMESSGRYHVNLMGYLLNLGYDVREFNPIEVHGYRISKIRKSKNDSIDTRIIAGALILNRKENTQRYIKDQDYVRMREIGLLHHRLVDKTSKLKVEMREALTILCPGYDALFTNVLGKSSKEILRRSVKHTKLFKISQEEIEDILRKNYMSKQVIEDKARKVIESFVKSTVPDNYKESLIVQIRFILD